ncbi:thermonuclease family protein [Methylobacterium sp. NEAU K]|uniref:thermonuclease family protein n=1 Tax=Methylobacterium sp. NEAU K TaxID=3064946 RepID=UPI0027370E60|nr:thermonuclease family protein [Methylobacterium sp. NEAU K]MDP4003759.1 thermonuclease family protein [Methylobacterium sp. NEAU K]
MSLILGALLACAAGLAGTLLCPDPASSRSRLPLLVGVLAGGLAWHAPARADEALRGTARVIDGGTLMVGPSRVSLFGIAAPDADQTCSDAQDRPYACGREAARALADHIGGAAITCEPRPRDAGGALVALCRIGDEDLAAWMVGRGLALPDRGAAPGYAAAADRAWGRRLGLWSGVFQDPAERRGRRADAAALRSAGFAPAI